MKKEIFKAEAKEKGIRQGKENLEDIQKEEQTENRKKENGVYMCA